MCGKCIFYLFERIAYFVTGEFLLKHRANSGSIVIIRSLLFSSVVFLFAIALSEATSPKTAYPPSFSLQELVTAIHCKINWFAALIGFSYLALYARFASQWNYLATLYNQIMQSRADSACDKTLITQRKKINHANQLTEREFVYANWMAGFIEDAVTLHLAEKSMYKSVIKSMRNIPGVEFVLDKETKKRLDKMHDRSK